MPAEHRSVGSAQPGVTYLGRRNIGLASRPGMRQPGQGARVLAFSRSNFSAEMTPRSRRSVSFASWSAVLAGELAAA